MKSSRVHAAGQRSRRIRRYDPHPTQRHSGNPPMASAVSPIGTMDNRALLFAAAVLVAAILLDSTLYDGRYLNATTRMIEQISTHFWGK